jgi:hypothetical protein
MASVFLVPRDKWPFLICGPMLRRVTPDQVAVFVAASESFTAKLLVRPVSSNSSQPPIVDPANQSPQSPIKLGDSLYVLVITLTLTPPISLTGDVVYEYDVQFTVASSVKVRTDAGNDLPRTTGPFGLSDLGLLAGTRRVGLSAGALPSFAIQSSREKLRLIHASCRKPHGGGVDAMPFITELFGPNAATSASDRPHYLLLTGDQIYADDVSTSLLWLLQETGRELMSSFTETLTLPSWPGGEVSFPGRDQQDAGEQRQKLMTHFKNVSSEHKESHLVFLAEFYAMYVLVWSPALWGPGWFVAWKSKSLFPSPEQEARDEYEKLAEDNTWPGEEAKRHQSVRTFAQGTSKVRRVLANVSTLMMFDDHEVSDDWNLNQTWRNASLNDPFLQRIVRNALLAFAAFQAWGNDPARFASGTTGRKLLDAVNPNTPTEENVFGTANCVDGLLRLGDFKASLPPSEKQPMLWHWAIDPALYDYRILALDTRTRRNYDDNSGPGLLQPMAMEQQLPVPPSGDLKVTFVLSPAPVLGHPLLEEVIQPLAKMLSKSLTADAEAWSMNRECLTDLLHRLANFRQVVLLSGDVHYAYSNRTDFESRNGPNSPSPRSVVFIQLCSSSAHNEERLTRTIEKVGAAGMGTRSWRGRRFGTWNDYLLPNDRGSVKNLITDALPDFGNGTSGPVKVDEKVMDELVREILNGISYVQLVTLALHLLPPAGPAIDQAGKTALVEQVKQNSPLALAHLYYLVNASTLPVLTNQSTNFAFTLPVGPWFSSQLRDAIRLILPDPTPTDTAWAWTWTTTFIDGPIERSSLPGPAKSYELGQQASRRTIVGLPNFGEVTFYRLSSGAERLEHRIHLIPFTDQGRVIVDHIADLDPLPVTRTWPEVYA